MPLARIKTWISGEVLTASDLNGEFNNIIDNLSFALSSQFADGTLANPSIAFVNDTDTGWYRPGANLIGMVAGGVEVLRASPYTSGVNYLLVAPGQAGQGAVLVATGSDTNVPLFIIPKGTGYVRVPTGTQGSERFYAGLGVGSPDTGLLSVTTGTIDLIANGRRVLQASAYTNATNYLLVSPSQSGQQVTLEPAGGDTNISLRLRGKGTGYADFIAGSTATFFRLVTATRSWIFGRESRNTMGSSEMLSIAPEINDDLKLYFDSVSGGQRVYIWDDSQTLPNTVSTGIKPAFAVFGDITVGDIDSIGTSPLTLFRRTATGLAASAVTQLFSAQNGTNDTDGGAQFILAPKSGGADEDGYAEVIAYGTGSGALANNIILSTRSGAGAVTRRWVVQSAGHLVPAQATVYDIGTTANQVRDIYAVRLRSQAGTSTSTGIAPVVLSQDAASGTGSPGDTNENNLKTYTLPSNALATDGDMLRVTLGFRCAANAITKRIRVYFGSTVVTDSTAIAQNNQIINVTMYVARTSATAQYAQAAAIETANGSAWSTAVTGGVAFPTAPTENVENTILIRSTITLGAGAALNDVIQDYMIVEYLRKP